MVSLRHRIEVMALVMVVSITPAVSVEAGGPVEQVGLMVDHVVDHHLPGCHLVIITTTRHSHVTSTILRHLTAGGEAVVVVEAGSVFDQDKLARDHLLQELWGGARTTCRGLILDLSSTNSTDFVLRLLEAAGLSTLPETVVIAIGGRAGVRGVLLHHSLRNTVHALYLALYDATFHTPSHTVSHFGKVHPPEVPLSGDDLLVYQRCLYCNSGEADVQLVLQGKDTPHSLLIANLFQEQLRDLMGHKFRVAAVTYFPYIDYKVDSQEPGSTVTLRDSVDTRLLNAFSTALNFTYKVREDPQRSWGVWKDGVFDGMMGRLQKEENDFCTESAPTPERLTALDYARGYPSDVMTVASLKPTTLPQYLSLVRPFAGELWVALLVSVVVWSVILWLLQKVWHWLVGGREVKFENAIMFGWGSLLGQPPAEPSINVSGQILVGWWLLFTLVVTTGYSSALVAHLTVQGTSKPLETLEDILKQHNWKWGTESSLFKGAVIEYFSKHNDPVVKHIYQGVEVLDSRKALEKVLAGGYSLIVFKMYISVIVASHYTDARGQTPFYISNKGISVLANLGWCFRKGAPFYTRVSKLMLRLEAAGITSFWTYKVVDQRIRDNREAAALTSPAGLQHSMDDEREVVLGLSHLQGAFYLLGLGAVIGFLTLLGENLAYCCSSRHHRP